MGTKFGIRLVFMGSPLLALLSCGGSTSSGSGSDAPSVAGRWAGSAIVGAPREFRSRDFTISLLQDGRNLGGTVSSPPCLVSREITEGRVRSTGFGNLDHPMYLYVTGSGPHFSFEGELAIDLDSDEKEAIFGQYVISGNGSDECPKRESGSLFLSRR